MDKMAAFLRAINVGGHTVRMEDLRALFAGMGFQAVETFIASGNVIFDDPGEDPAVLEARIEGELQARLGYPVATFLRSAAQLAALTAHAAFPPERLAAAAALNVALLKAPPGAEGLGRLDALRSPIDDFAVQGRELYWLCLKKQSESTFSNAVLEKALRSPSTLRGLNTLHKLSEKYPA